VADRFDLRRDIAFDTRVLSAEFDEQSDLWTVRTDRGHMCARAVLHHGGGVPVPAAHAGVRRP
jgi:cyclohexanone monooxygenase